MPADCKTTIAMTLDLKQAVALVLLGIAIGCAVSHFYFAGFIDDRAGDGLPISMNGKLYEVQAVDRGTNLLEMRGKVTLWQTGSNASERNGAQGAAQSSHFNAE